MCKNISFSTEMLSPSCCVSCYSHVWNCKVDCLKSWLWSESTSTIYTALTSKLKSTSRRDNRKSTFCNCLFIRAQVAQPVDKTQILRLDEGGGEVPSYGWRQDNNNSIEIRGPLASTKEHQLFLVFDIQINTFYLQNSWT